MEISNETKFKVALQYYGCDFLVCYNIEGNPVIEKFSGRNIDEGLYEPDAENKRELLILKSLSSLTKEDAVILNDMSCGNSEFRISYFEGGTFGDTILDWTSFNFNQYQYLISQFYDIPHRLLKVGGRTHTDLLDGKTLKEAGMAIYESDIKLMSKI